MVKYPSSTDMPVQWNLEFLTSLTKHAVQHAWDKLDILEHIQI